MEFEAFELKDENLRKLNLHIDGKMTEGIWIYLTDEDAKRYDADTFTMSYDAVAVLANAPIMFYPDNFWGAYIPVKFNGKNRPTCNVAELRGSPLFHTKKDDSDPNAEKIEVENDVEETNEEIDKPVMKNITLQTAVALAINAYLAAGIPFSAYDVTLSVRDNVDYEYTVKDAGLDWDDDGDAYSVIDHDEVKALVVELFENGLFKASKSYGSSGGINFIVYNPLVVDASQAPAPVTAVADDNDPILDKIKSYLSNKGSATLKQVQSALKIKGVKCEDIAKLLNLSNATQLNDSISKVVVKG